MKKRIPSRVILITMCLFIFSFSNALFGQIDLKVDPKCKQLLDSGEYHLYTSKNYTQSKKFLIESKDCFLSNNNQVPGVNYLNLAKAFYYDYQDSLSGVNYLNAIKVFEIQQDNYSLSTTYNSLGNLISDTGNYDSALHYFDKSIIFCDKSKNSLGVAIALNNKGNALKNLGRYDLALEALYKSLSVYKEEKAGDKRLSLSMLNIGALLDILGKTDGAIEFYRSSVELKKNIKDSTGIAKIYNNIGVIYKNKSNYDSANFYYQLSTDLAKNSSDLSIKWDNHINIGTIKMLQENTLEAKKSYDEALKIANKMNDQGRIGESYYQLGNYFLGLDNASNAIVYFEKALPIVIKSKSYQDLMDLYKKMSEGYSKQQKFQSALEMRLLMEQNKDSIYKNDQIKAMEDIIGKYELEKKDHQLLQQKSELDQKQSEIQKQIGLIIILILLVLIIVIWYHNRRKQQQVHHQMTMNKERSRIAMDLHDHLGAELTIINSKLDTSAYKSKNQAEKEALQTISSQVRQAGKILRETVWSIQNEAVDVGALVERIESFSKQLLANSNTKFLTTTNCPNHQLTSQQALDIYRILQESITNTFKYAQASKIELNINLNDKILSISISDNGNGFDIESESSGFGLKNMRTRVEKLDGKLELNSSKTSGTNIFFELNLTQ